MATKVPSIIPSEPQQPEMLAYPLMDKVPAHCSVFVIGNDRLEPILSFGDCVVIDNSDREPEHEELFLMQWSSSSRRQICATWFAPVPEGHSMHGRMWAGNLRPQQMETLSGEKVGEPIRWGDGPYKPEALAKKIVGRVVGLVHKEIALDAFGIPGVLA